MMPSGDPRDRFFYPTLTLMMDSYCLQVTVIQWTWGSLRAQVFKEFPLLSHIHIPSFWRHSFVLFTIV